MIARLQMARIADSKKSILLLGPRQVGKSTLIRELKPDMQFNLADERTYLDFASDPGLIVDFVERKKPKLIFIDEVQRLPSILNTVQALVDENKALKFYLTGSSARKLKRGGANLLPGRVINFYLGPIVARELDYKFNVLQALKFGFLPEVLTLKDDAAKRDLLLSYSASYIREEIQAEALTRSLEAFSRFLNEASRNVGLFLDYTKLASRAKISRHTCPNFFEILEDTMLAFRIYPDPSLFDRIDLVKHPKLYFFDIGVFNGIEKTFDTSSRRIGALMEQLVFQQLHHSANALGRSLAIHTFRTRGGLEVDFLVRLDDKEVLIEVKSSASLQDSDADGLRQAKSYLPNAKSFIFFPGTRAKKLTDTWALPISEGLKELGL